MLEEFRPELPPHYALGYGLCWAAVLGVFWAVLWWRARRREQGGRTGLMDAGLSAIVVVAILLAAEGLFVLFYDTSDSFAMSNVARRWFWRHVRTNNRKFRDNVDYTVTPPRGVFRIGVLGDSFAFGHGVPRVEDRFSNQLRQRLEEIAPGRYQVYNLSYPGWDTGQQMHVVDALAAMGFRYDLIVLAYVLNDGCDLLPESGEFHVKLQELQPQFPLLKYTYLPNFVYYRLRILGLPQTRGYYDWSQKAFEEPYWSQQQGRLRYLRVACARLGARLCVATFPYLHHLGPDYPFKDTHRRLAEFWEAEEVTHIDLLDTFGGHEPAELVVNAFDAHPNERAHALAAEAIYRDLVGPVVGLSEVTGRGE